MTQPIPMNPISVGLDDGYAYTKLVMPDGRMFATPSRARLGKANVTTEMKLKGVMENN